MTDTTVLNEESVSRKADYRYKKSFNPQI